MKSRVFAGNDRIEEFKNNAEQSLFDIASCKCKNLKECFCPKGKKVPVLEREFIIDQRGARRMKIGSIDSKETSRIQLRTKRRQQSIDQLLMKPPTVSATVELTESSQSSSQPITDSDSDFEIRKRIVKKRQMDYGRLVLE